jgi:hypothetical protein
VSLQCGKTSLYRHKHIAKYLTTTMCFSVHVQVVPSWDEMVWITNFVGETNIWLRYGGISVPECPYKTMQNHLSWWFSMAHLHFATTFVCGWVTFLYHGVPSHHSKPWFAYMWHLCFWVPLQNHLRWWFSMPDLHFATTIVCSWVTFLYHSFPSNLSKPSTLMVFYCTLKLC